MFFAIPLSLIVAIYLSEYSDNKSVFSKILNFSINIMASTPSILFGMFGLAIFITFFHMPLSILSASLTLTFLVLPIMIKSMESSLSNVPQYQKMSALALGASKTESI
jgi:phosphate transport system permease protein